MSNNSRRSTNYRDQISHNPENSLKEEELANEEGFVKTTYTEQIIAHIKRSILRGKLSPGQKIKEVKIAEEMKISRAPVREALQTLVEQGLVVSIPQKGKFVANPTAKQILDSYVLCGVLEGYVAASTMDRFTEEDFRNLDSLLNEMKTATKTDRNLDFLVAQDIKFHEIMYSKSDNQTLTNLSLKNIRGIFHLLFVRHWEALFLPDEVYDRHHKLLECIKKRNKIEIEEVFRAHYAEAGRRMAKFGSTD